MHRMDTSTQDLFLPSTVQEIVSRIEKLTPVTQPLWGKMSVSQMLAHCQAPLEVALGEKKSKRSIIGFMFGRLAKKKLVGKKPFGRNLPTDRSFLITEVRNFEEEKRKLIAVIERFHAVGPRGLSKDPHPFFGKMTPEEWTMLSYKHLDHHLQQFGV